MADQAVIRPAIVVFGSKVHADGVPSGSLRRRTLGALEWARQRGVEPLYVVSGGSRSSVPEEAEVMRRLLVDNGVDLRDIVMDKVALDTVQNAVNTSRIVSRLRAGPIFICSDDYHVPRCWLLMTMCGAGCKPIFLAGSRRAVGHRRWLRYCAHETRAVVRDAVTILRDRTTRKSRPVIPSTSRRDI